MNKKVHPMMNQLNLMGTDYDFKEL